jgi:hypothetical protein
MYLLTRLSGLRTLLRDEASVVDRLRSELELTRDEAVLYIELLKKGSIPSSTRSKELLVLVARGMAILSGDDRRYIPVHPRLAVANHFRTWRDKLVKEMNEKRMRVDRLILELIPVYEGTTEKKPASGRAGS